MEARDQILELFESRKEMSVKEIGDELEFSKQTIHTALNRLLEDGRIEKLGRTPKTIYRIRAGNPVRDIEETFGISGNDEEFLKKNFLAVTENGELIEGITAFGHWCKQRKMPILKTLQEFIATKKRYEGYYDPKGNINGMEKLKSTKGYEKIWLDQLYYLDFYAIERFGKTKLGTLLHYAKQGQSKLLMSIMLKEIAPRIKKFVNDQKVDAIGFVPPTIRREVQLMKYLETHLKIPLPAFNIKKLSGIIPVPQKSLSKLDERIRNADNTFAVTGQQTYKHLVLIDDAVGSGATLNQVARKIKTKNLAEKVIGLAIVGSFKGFDVITDI